MDLGGRSAFTDGLCHSESTRIIVAPTGTQTAFPRTVVFACNSATGLLGGDFERRASDITAPSPHQSRRFVPEASACMTFYSPSILITQTGPSVQCQ